MSASRARLLLVLAAALLALLTVGAAGTPAGAADAPSPSAAPESAQEAGTLGQTGPATIEVVMDTSGSMSEDDGAGIVKIEGARTALLDFLASAEPETKFGLRSYPDPDGSGGCNTGVQQIAIKARNTGAMAAKIRTLAPNGDTPTAEALTAAADDLEHAGVTHGAIVLVSDGMHTCPGEPCDAAKAIAARGVDLQVITVGFRIPDNSDAERELQCVADATGGKHVDAGNTGELNDTLSDLTRPKLTATLDYPQNVIADVGNGPDGLVSIAAHVRNDSDVAARAARARLRFTGASPGVVSPTRALGNVEGRGQAAGTWQIRPGPALIGKDLSFEVRVTADNLRSDVVVRGSIHVSDATLASAGPVLRDAKRIAILGDSFSAGEGAGNYTPETDTLLNSCHRSLVTYLLPALGQPVSNDLACSGAVTADLNSPNSRGLPAQVNQLVDRQNQDGPRDLVALTTGGNDVGFANIIKACLIGDCSTAIDGRPTADFLSDGFNGLGDTLLNGYVGIDQKLNSDDQVRKRGRQAPILVLAYPRILPGADRACGLFSSGITNEELELAANLSTRLNGTIRGAVDSARKLGVPAYFVGTPENAFLPSHTFCDRDSYLHGLDPEVYGLLAKLYRASAPEVRLDLKVKAVLALSSFDRDKNQAFHPTRTGYAAETRAIIRWSLTPAGLEAAKPPEHDRTPLPSLAISGPAPGALVAPVSSGQVLQPGSAADLNVSGFAPNTQVTVAVHSRRQALADTFADSAGALRLTIYVPRSTPAGQHTISVAGLSPDGQPLTRGFPVQVELPRSTSPVLAAVPGAGLTALGLLFLGVRRLLMRRRRDVRDEPEAL